MIGAIIGDIIGSVYEFNNVKSKDFQLFCSDSRFTDDTVLTVATMDSLLNNTLFDVCYRKWYRKYSEAGYGGRFKNWAESDSDPYNSWGNGSAMRVSPIGLYYNELNTVLRKAEESASVTHNHEEGIKGAKATAAAIFYAKKGYSKEYIKNYIQINFKYDLSESLESIRSWYQFDVSCGGSVPQAIISFLESTDFEDAIRNAVSIGGDSDTIACITGGIAEAYYKNIPDFMKKNAFSRLTQEQISIIEEFYKSLGNVI
jgi:ADP-ribosylglycohydrolase